MADRGERGSRRRRRSPAEGRALVAEYRASGESVAAFCRRAGVGAAVLRRWLDRETGDKAPSSEFFVLSKPPAQLTPSTKPSTRERKPERGRTTACIVVVADATATMLARTVHELLSGTGS